MLDGIVYLGATAQRTATNRNGHVVNVSRNALRAGVNLVATDLLSVLPVFASVIEDVMGDGDRVICFHDDGRLQGISTGFDVLNIGGTITGARIRESDGRYVAAYALANPKRHIFINLSQLDAGSPARFIAEFDKAYRDAGDGARDFELVANYGIHRSITRSRDSIGDTRATHDVMRFQHLAGMRNIGILNAANSLTELPREFVTNCPNLGFGRIMLPKHYNEMSSHVPEEDMPRIRLCKKDDGYGVMKVENGPLTYYPGSDVPNNLGREMPFVLLPAELKSDIGKDPKDPSRPKKNRHVDHYVEFVDKAREEQAGAEEAARTQRIAAKAIRDMKDKAVKAGAVARAAKESGVPVVAKTIRPSRGTRRTANDNVVHPPFGRDADADRQTIAMLLEAADVAHPAILAEHAPRTLNARDGLFNAPPHRGLTPQAVALHVIGSAHVQEAILAANALADREGEGRICAAAVAAACLDALAADQDHARRFIEDEIHGGDTQTVKRLRHIGAEASATRRDEAQFHLVRSSWFAWRSIGSALPNAA